MGALSGDRARRGSTGAFVLAGLGLAVIGDGRGAADRQTASEDALESAAAGQRQEMIPEKTADDA